MAKESKIKSVHKQFSEKYFQVDQDAPKTMAEGFQYAVEKSGRSAWAIMFEACRLMVGPTKLKWKSYVGFGLYRKGIPYSKKKKFVEVKQNRKLTNELTRTTGKVLGKLINDKVMFKLLVDAYGFSTVPLQLYLGNELCPKGVKSAGNAQELASFLLKDAVYPIFCKPIDGSLGRGVLSILSVGDDKKTLNLGNGDQVQIGTFCDDIFEYYSDGYMIEDMVVQHDAITEVFGATPIVLRIVTAMEKDQEPELLYTLLRAVFGKAMGTIKGVAKVYRSGFDPVTGEIDAEIYSESKYIGETPLSEIFEDTPFKGFKIPFAQEAVNECLRAHKLFPDKGRLGFDVIITQNGPLFLECNLNPFCFSVQILNDHGLMDGHTGEVLSRVIASNK